MSVLSTTLQPTDRAIDRATLGRRVEGIGVADNATLGSVLAGAHTDDTTRLLVFLRHFG